jgi:IclR family pca regulon transcriptional regulator
MSGDPDFMQSLARGLDVLAAFSTLEPPHTVSQIAERTGLARPVVRRCLHTLVKEGFVAETKHRYEVLPRVLLLTGSYHGDKSLPALAQPTLERLRDLVGESSSLGVLDDEEVIYVARAPADRIISISMHVGTRLPAYCTSLGRVLLAALAPEERDWILAKATIIQRTPQTIIDIDQLKAEIAAVARRGYAIVEHELEFGLRSLAVPVRNRSGRVLAALNIGASTARVAPGDMEAKMLPHLLDAATTIGALAH